ncbi:uroporphyrinogen-III synthase [Halomarina rubra]|uniref:Uroporphyrinogen-III synthase n=1 Tax=Halomarina rubra TaxID=2071873 RepID=A0ABD6AXJ1_9EURY|nr:uroporphyrinogen-III synthase [Halomarina rubra]
MRTPTVAVFRPDDGRISEAVEFLESLGVDAVPDPMLTVQPTGERPGHAEFCIFTSPTGVEIAAETGWTPKDATVCAVGQSTASVLREHEYQVDVVPSTFTSTGLVESLAPAVMGKSVELARSAHGSNVLIDGLESAGASVSETVLYRLERPHTAGHSVLLAVDGKLDGVLFTSPRTVDHFFECKAETLDDSEIQQALNGCVVGAIGSPTARRVRAYGLAVSVVPDSVEFEQLAEDTVERIQRTLE